MNVVPRDIPGSAPETTSLPLSPVARLLSDGVGLCRVAAVFYVAATLLGVAMRFALAGRGVGVPFDHLLHAHSHTLYFGWAALGLLAGAIGTFSRVTKLLARTLIGMVAGVSLLFVGFLVTAYHPVTIILSGLVMLCWYLVAGSWWRQNARLGPTAAMAIRGGLVYLVVSSFGVWALGAIRASNGTALDEGLAVHAFLLGFGWFFVLTVVGLTFHHGKRLGLSLDEVGVRKALRWWMWSAWITFPLGVVGGPEVLGLGDAARLAGIVLLVPGFQWVRAVWKGALPGPNQILHRAAASWFALATITTAVVAVGGTPALLAAGRSGVVIYLHALFVGFVTPSLVLVLHRSRPQSALILHHMALAGMLVGLALVPLTPSAAGLWIAAGASVCLWLAGVWWGSGLISPATTQG